MTKLLLYGFKEKTYRTTHFVAFNIHLVQGNQNHIGDLKKKKNS